ncbi:hypothetical protein Tco_1370420 [Tanacetum coccineum]
MNLIRVMIIPVLTTHNPRRTPSIVKKPLIKFLKSLKELKKRITKEQTAKENMSIEEMRHEQQLVDRKIKEIMNDLDFNEWGSEVRKKEQAYKEEQYSAARRRMLSITCDDQDDFIPLGDIIARYSTSKAITPDLPIEEPDNSLSMGDEHLDTIPATESDEVIKSSVEILVPIPSELEGISDDTCDVPVCDDSSTFDALNDNSEILSDSNNDGTSSDDDDYEDVEFEEMNDVDQEEKEFDLEDIFQIQDVIL